MKQIAWEILVYLRTGFSPCDIDKLLRENTFSVMNTISCPLQIQITWWKVETFDPDIN